MLTSAIRDVKQTQTVRYHGQITRLEGLRIEATGPGPALVLGASARLGDRNGPRAEIVGFEDDRALLLACEDAEGLFPGANIYIDPTPAFVSPADHWLGRTIDAFGLPIDGQGPLVPGPQRRRLRAHPPSASARSRVDIPLHLGVTALDVFTPCGRWAKAWFVCRIWRWQIDTYVHDRTPRRRRCDRYWTDR